MTDATSNVKRRTVLRMAGGLAGAGVLASASQSAAAAPGFGGWLDGTDNYDGVVDATGKQRVTVTVGAEGNGGNFAFGPAAIRVDPGTTVVWEWSGKGGAHDVTAKDGSFGSEMVGEAGHTFEHAFDAAGTHKYYCSPHKALGMRGVVVVGDGGGGAATESASDGGSTSDDGPKLDESWFSDVDNYDGVVDATGNAEVTVTVGAKGNGGNFAFGPAAIRVDPGTTVVWEWSGKGGAHDVTAKDGSFGSEMVGEAGHTFEHAFEETGVSEYYCQPHKALGMKGAVVVGGSGGTPLSEVTSAGGATAGGSGGDGSAQPGTAAETASAASSSGSNRSTADTMVLLFGGGLAGALLSPFAFGAFLANKERKRERTGR